MIMIDGKILNAILRGTDIEVVFELTPKQYEHWQYLLGQRVDESTPLDQHVVAEMQAVLEHFV